MIRADQLERVVFLAFCQIQGVESEGTNLGNVHVNIAFETGRKCKGQGTPDLGVQAEEKPGRIN